MEHQAGYREWAPAEPLSRHVACTWAGRLGSDGTPFTDRVLPDGCVDIIWDGSLLFVAGPDTGPVEITRQAGAYDAGVRFRPGLAPAAAAGYADQAHLTRECGRLGGAPPSRLVPRLAPAA